MQPRRKIITYKSRNRRKRDQDDEQNRFLTSPLSEIDKDETTLPEMNRRMGKRSRLLAASSVPDLSAIADTSTDPAPARNSKRSRAGDDAPATSGPLSTVFNAELHSNSFQTPLTSALPTGKRTPSGYLHHRSASSLSPVPPTKPVFNSVAKENFANSQLQTYLASPFNSQPNSRTASPIKSQSKPKPTKRPRAKSRILSAHLPENREITAPATDTAPSPDRKKAKTLHHGGNPSLPSFAVDDSPEWLNYAGAKPARPVRGGRRRIVPPHLQRLKLWVDPKCYLVSIILPFLSKYLSPSRLRPSTVASAVRLRVQLIGVTPRILPRVQKMGMGPTTRRFRRNSPRRGRKRRMVDGMMTRVREINPQITLLGS